MGDALSTPLNVYQDAWKDAFPGILGVRGA